MKKTQIIELIERNPTIGKLTSKKDIDLMDEIYHQLTGKRIKNKGCASCISGALRVIRGEYGYPTKNKEINKKLSNKRIEMCKQCIHSQGSSVFLTCGTPVVGNEVPEGKLCGCFVYVKAKFKNETCPLGFWDK